MSFSHQALRLSTVCVTSVPKLLMVGCQCRHSSHLRVDKIQPPKVIIPIDPDIVDPERLFSAPVLEFIEARHEENKNGKTALVTNFLDGKPTGIVNINNYIFNTNARIDIIHHVVVWQRACARRGTASTKTRAEVRGGGRKPWPQKGTGRARQGSIRAPQWRGGGVVHGPKPRSYAYDISPRVVEYGLRAALSCRFAQGDFYLVDNFDGVSPYEEDLVPLLERNGWNDALLVDGLPNKSLLEATAPLRKFDTCSGRGMTVLDIMRRERLVMSLDALRVVEDYLTREKRVPTVPNKGMAGRFNPDED